jgi:hypothetical protein
MGQMAYSDECCETQTWALFTLNNYITYGTTKLPFIYLFIYLQKATEVLQDNYKENKITSSSYYLIGSKSSQGTPRQV